MYNFAISAVSVKVFSILAETRVDNNHAWLAIGAFSELPDVFRGRRSLHVFPEVWLEAVQSAVIFASGLEAGCWVLGDGVSLFACEMHFFSRFF